MLRRDRVNLWASRRRSLGSPRLLRDGPVDINAAWRQLRWMVRNEVALPPPAYHPARTHADLGAAFFDAVVPTEFPETRLRFRNDPWAARIGLDALSDGEWTAHFGRFQPLPNTFVRPLALRYHGHQFRVYNPEIGDGRGFLFAQAYDAVDGRLLDLGTKGSGTTPWSRTGDGRLTLKGGLREILATEMLEALGVYTSKTFSLIETGEKLYRTDEPSPTRSSVLVRLSHSHIRIGTFQRYAALGQPDAVRRLVDHCIAHYWPEAAAAPDPVAGFYAAVLDAVARMGAEWFAAGFVHGVINSDNVNITGESFDYGPWRFLDRFDPGFTAAYFDQTGLYCFARQPEAVHWNLARLGECLMLIAPRSAIEPVFDSFPARFQEALARQTLARLGLAAPESDGGADRAVPLVHDFWSAMNETRPPFQQVFFDLLGGGAPQRLRESPIRATYETAAFAEVTEALRGLTPLPGLAAALAHPYAAGPGPETMVIEEVEAIWDAIDRDDDWRPLHDKVARLRAMGRCNAALGLLSGAVARPRHLPLGADAT